MAVVAVNVAVFALELVWGGCDSPPTLHRMGAGLGRAGLVREPWRIISAAFLHFGVAHLLLNMWALLVFGRMLEIILGARRFLVLYALSAAAGGLASSVFHAQALSAGASGAVWGLMTGQIALVVRLRQQQGPDAVPVRMSSLLQPLVVNLLFSLTPGLDMAAHLGGGVAGAGLILSGLIGWRRPEPPGWRPAAWGASLAMAACLAVALGHGRPWELRWPPPLVPRAIPGTPVVVPVPGGLRPAPTGGGDAGVFGDLGSDPLAVYYSAGRLKGPLAEQSRPDALSQMARDEAARPLEKNQSWDQVPRLVQLGQRPAVFSATHFRDAAGIQTWLMVEGSWWLRLDVVLRPDAPGSWAKLPTAIAEGITIFPSDLADGRAGRAVPSNCSVDAGPQHTAGLAAFKQNDYSKAIELLRKATEADPKGKEGFLDLGRALSAAGRNEEAVKAFSRQIENEPSHDSAYAWRAYALERTGRWEEAEKDLLKQIEVAPLQAWSYQRLGERRTGQRRFREAARFYSRAAAVEPKAAIHWVSLAWAHARDARPKEAWAALVRARALDLPDWMRIDAGGVYDLIGEAATAGQLAESGAAPLAQGLASLSADAFSENDLWRVEYLARAWHLIGAAAIAAGDTTKGERYLAAAWRLWFLPEAAWALGNLRERQGRLAEAVAFWSMAADVPTAEWSLPADRQRRIEAACRRLSTAGSRPSALPNAKLKAADGSTPLVELVTVLPATAPQIEAQHRLTELRTITVAGGVLSDLTEEVLLLVRPDGNVERVRDLSRKQPEVFERQLAKLGPIRIPHSKRSAGASWCAPE